MSPETAPGFKWCRRCESVKSLDLFGPHSGTKDGLQTYCRECYADLYRSRRVSAGFTVRPADIPDGHKFCRGCKKVKPLSEWSARAATSDGYSFRCRDCIRLRDRERHLANTYGLSSDDVAELLAGQGGICVVCLRAPAVHVDHDHTTGEIRGMLCFPCNVGIGHLDDDPDTLRRAAEYLEGRRIAMSRPHPGVVLLSYPDRPAPAGPGVLPTASDPSSPLVDIRALRPATRSG